MRPYVVVTGILFALVTLAHVARMVMEDGRLATDPLYLLMTASTAALACWSWAVLRRPASGKQA